MPIKSYYNIQNSQTGQLGISSYVFSQIALDARESMLKGDLREVLADHQGRSKANVVVDIDPKNHVTIRVEVFGYKGADLRKGVEILQEAIYQHVYDLTEIREVKVDVAVIGMLAKAED